MFVLLERHSSDHDVLVVSYHSHIRNNYYSPPFTVRSCLLDTTIFFQMTSKTVTEKEQNEEKGIALAVSETIENLQNLLKQRELELDEREQELKRATLAFESEHATYSAKASDVLRLNVGGTMIAVLRRNLTSVEGSLLAMQFSGRWDDGLSKDSDGNIFLDHQPDLFLLLIDYLRDKDIDVPSAPRQRSPVVQDSFQNIRFMRLLEYYNVTLGVYPFSAYRLDDPSDVEFIRGIYTGHTISNSTGSP